MFVGLCPFMLFLFECLADDYYYTPYNVTRSTLSGIAAYRSSLTLDWLAAEDSRQRELAAAFEREASPVKIVSMDCMAYPRPAPGKIGRLMLEMLKNLEGDEGTLIPELINALIRSKLLVDTSHLESEPDFDSLVETPGVMMGEPHATFPRILAVIWMLITDASTTRKFGWCPVKKVNQYILLSKSSDIARQMRTLEAVLARARFVMEEFIQNVTPINIYQKKTTKKAQQSHQKLSTTHDQKHAMKPRAHEEALLPHQAISQSASPEITDPSLDIVDGKYITVANFSTRLHCTSSTADLDTSDPEFFQEDRWTHRNVKEPPNEGSSCLQTHPTNRDIIKRFHAILPFFDKDHSNTEFLHKYRASVYAMSDGEDLLDREAAFYAAVLTPLVFLQNYRDAWCLLQRVRTFVWELPGPASASRTTTEVADFDSEEFHDKKDIRYLKELIKNLG